MLSESIAKLVQYGITTGLTPEEKEEQKKAKLKEFIELAETLSAQEIEAIECVMKLIKRE